ncbi:MAG TPA: arginase family protein [Gaiellaceae bacterium]|nr:arginase family protein [Gaiellaceae bacterium]
MSRLRARCPDCRTLTAVALGGGDYECHSCGRVFKAGLVRVPRAWGEGGESMAEAAYLPLPFPEVGVVDEESLGEQSLALAAALPERPLVLGGCCCAHVGAVEGLATRHERLAVVWFDAHADLNTPESSPSGNLWGMPLRMLVDGDIVAPDDIALVGARNLDPPEEEFIAAHGVHVGEDAIDRALEGVQAVYVAFDADVLDPDEDVLPFMPEPGGLTLVEAAAALRGIVAERLLAGAGLTGLTPAPANGDPLAKLTAALGL